MPGPDGHGRSPNADRAKVPSYNGGVVLGLGAMTDTGSDVWPRLRGALKRFADAGGSPQEAIDALESIGINFSGLSTVEISPESAIAAIEEITRPSEQAAEVMRSLGIRLSGLSTVEIDLPRPTPSELDARGFTHAQPTACARCLYHSSNPLLACAVHPLGRPGEVCDDWEDGGTAEWEIKRPQTYETVEDTFNDGVLTERVTRRYSVETGRLIDQLVTNSPEHGRGGCDRA